jgi:hypothetical protein
MSPDAAAQPWLSRALGVLPPAQSPARWHVSPLVDALAYHWSWLPLLVPLVLFTGDTHPTDYRLWMSLVLAGNFTHQALSLAFVYLDTEIFRRFPRRFTVFPGVMAVLLMASIVGWRLDQPYRHVHFVPLFGFVAFVAYSWNFWHVYMQKFGILRLYNAKSGPPDTPKVARWVDGWLVWGWMPLYFTVLPTEHAAEVYRFLPYMAHYTKPLLTALQAARPFTEPLCWAALAASLGAWAWHEARANRMRNAPRLSMALALTLLGAAVLFFNPIKAIIAYGFSHVLEYVVFVWAYQRRYYHAPLPHDPPVQRILRYPATAFLTFVVFVGGTYFVLANWRWLFGERLMLGSIPLALVMLCLPLYLSMVHFYYDGFLWKMRRPVVRENV